MKFIKDVLAFKISPSSAPHRILQQKGFAGHIAGNRVFTRMWQYARHAVIRIQQAAGWDADPIRRRISELLARYTVHYDLVWTREGAA